MHSVVGMAPHPPGLWHCASLHNGSCSRSELNAQDDNGWTLTYAAVWYDRPISLLELLYQHVRSLEVAFDRPLPDLGL